MFCFILLQHLLHCSCSQVCKE